jgi:YbbR domain-containing protein
VFRSLVSQLGSIFLALVLATTVWVVATNDENPSREAWFPDKLPIEFANLEPGLVVYHKSVEAISVKVLAPQATWDQLHDSSFHVIADLKGLGAGEHTVKLQVKTSDSSVTITAIDPVDTVDVQLQQVKSRVMDVQSDVLDGAPPGYTFRTPVITPTQVTISGPAVLVDQVNDAVADIYLRGSKVPVEREVTVLARDALGNLIQGLTITPPTVNVKVQVEQRIGYKDVSIQTILKGAPAPGYWVSNITVNPSTATIVGSPDALAKIPGYVETVPIDITGATADVTRQAVLSVPGGVSVLNNQGITVQISVTPILGGQTVHRKVTIQGLAQGLTASVSPDSVEIILSGPVPALQSLGPNDVQVVVDATNLAPGTYSLKPRTIAVPNSLRVQSIVPDTVQVTISGTTPAPSATPTRTSNISSTGALTSTTSAATPTATP